MLPWSKPFEWTPSKGATSDPLVDAMRGLAERAYDTARSAPWLGWSERGRDTAGEWKLFANETGGAVALAFRGTVNRADAVTDLMMVGGTLADRFQRALNAAQEALRGASTVYLTGHSLGGTLALWVSHKLGLRAYAFAPYITARFGDFRYTPRMTIVVNKLDPVSWETYEWRAVVPGHESANWVVDTRLPEFSKGLSGLIGHTL